ncbi:MAG TPA: beta-propeller domain-containing protein [Anaeromyxobacteraceae bacterium]|nr:beta-propeller domain-containing protein [Anaeromyxobacteraceae bacterium]
MPTRLYLALLALLAGAACSGERGRTPLPRNLDVDPTPTLEQFASCPELEDAIEDALVLQMRSILEQSRVWGVPIFADGGGVAPAAAGPSDYTTTNSQVEGVGEADFVQNDGTRIAVVTGDQLHLARSWPPESLALASSTPIEGWPHDLFLAGERAVVFSSVYAVRALEGDGAACPMAGMAGAGFACGYWADNVVKITVLDVADLSAPALLSETYLPGSYVSARLVGDRVRLVTSDTFPFPDGVRFWADVPPGASEEQIAAALAALADENEALIRARSLDDWLRRGRVSRPGLPDVDLGYACTDFARSSGPSLPGLLTVATLDVGSGSPVSRASVLAEPGVVYASPATLYVASRHWWWWPEPGQRDATYLHAFDLGDPDRAVYVGSGVVDGFVRDQYALDEHAGALRVATTVSVRVDDGTEWGRIETAGRLSVLVREGGALALVGETPAFGAGERVFGTRFLGTRGFVITARQIDPLFTFDLSDPAHPAVVGELKMPGFISYLHPVDDTHLLGVGMQPEVTGGPNQVKIALLDVADLENPIDVATVLVGEGTWSEAVWDPKAFTWFGARNLLAMPFVDWSEATGLVSDLRLFRVDPAAGTIAPAGALSMDDLYRDDSTPYAWYWSPFVRRGILADDFVYAVSDAGIRSASVAQLPAWLATVELPPYAGF